MPTIEIQPLEPRRLLAFPLLQGGGLFDGAAAVALDPQNATIVAGVFAGTADFQPGSSRTELTAVGETDAFIARYSENGKLLWARQIGGRFGEELDEDKAIDLGLRPDRAGGFVNGVTTDPADLGEYVNALGVDAQGNIYVGAIFTGTADMDPGPGELLLRSPRPGFYDIALLKLNRDGQLLWARQLYGPFNDNVRALAVTADGGVAIGGYFSRYADFDGGPGVVRLDAEGRNDLFVARYDADGNLVFATRAGGDATREAEREMVASLALGSDGDLFITGTFARTARFDATRLEASRYTDAFVARVDGATGAFEWARRTGGKFYDGGAAIAVAPDGSLRTLSYFQRDADVDPGSGERILSATPEDAGDTPEQTDLVVSALSDAGDLVWAYQVAGTGIETAGGLVVHPDGTTVIAGGFYGTLSLANGAGATQITSTGSFKNREFEDPDDRDRRLSYDGYYLALSGAGAYAGIRVFGTQSDDWVTAIAPAPTRQIIVAGRSRGTIGLPFDDRIVRRRGLGSFDFFLTRDTTQFVV